MTALDPLSSFRLDGKVAVVTGASSGIGARFARVLHGLGATVVLAARRTHRLKAHADELGDGRAFAVACDVSVRGASEALIDGVVEQHGSADVVVANAGIANPTIALREEIDDFAGVLEVDLVAPFEIAKATAKHARAAGRGASIVMISSANGFHSTPVLPQASYVASKAGLIGLTRELALQWSRYGVRVNALCPGMFPSELTADLVESDELRERFVGAVALGRLGEPHELDGALAFLASDASTYVTGSALLVDGGWGL